MYPWRQFWTFNVQMKLMWLYYLLSYYNCFTSSSSLSWYTPKDIQLLLAVRSTKVFISCSIRLYKSFPGNYYKICVNLHLLSMTTMFMSLTFLTEGSRLFPVILLKRFKHNETEVVLLETYSRLYFGSHKKKTSLIKCNSAISFSL